VAWIPRGTIAVSPLALSRHESSMMTFRFRRGWGWLLLAALTLSTISDEITEAIPAWREARSVPPEVLRWLCAPFHLNESQCCVSCGPFCLSWSRHPWWWREPCTRRRDRALSRSSAAAPCIAKAMPISRRAILIRPFRTTTAHAMGRRWTFPQPMSWRRWPVPAVCAHLPVPTRPSHRAWSILGWGRPPPDIFRWPASAGSTQFVRITR